MKSLKNKINEYLLDFTENEETENNTSSNFSQETEQDSQIKSMLSAAFSRISIYKK